MPRKVSEFGLVRAGGAELSDGVLPYELHTPLFSDYADKARGIWMPPGAKATVDADGNVRFPVGTVLIKSFGWADANDGKPVETRLLIHRSDGWTALPSVWDADGRDATLAIGGRRIPVRFAEPDGTTRSISYAVPNKNQCKECHALDGAIAPIGPKLRNIRFGAAYRTNAAGRIEGLSRQVAALPAWDNPASGSVAERARAYLDVNCAHCHNPKGSASNSGLFLRWTDDPAGVNYGIGKRPTAEELAAQNFNPEAAEDFSDQDEQDSEQATRQALAMAVTELTPQIARQIGVPTDLKGVVVAAVDPSGDAATKGIRRGDVILSINNRAVSSAADVDRLIAEARAANREAVLLRVQRRAGQPQFLPVRLRTK